MEEHKEEIEKAIGITGGGISHPNNFFYLRIGFVLYAEFKKGKYKYLG
jgi:hypothetical protein